MSASTGSPLPAPAPSAVPAARRAPAASAADTRSLGPHLREIALGLLVGVTVLVTWIAATAVVLPAATLANLLWDRATTVVLVGWCTYGLSASGLVFMRPRSMWWHLAVIAAIACACLLVLGLVLGASIPGR